MHEKLYWDMIMLIKKIALVGFVVVLTGCANSEGLEKQVSTLTQTVNKLTSKVNSLSSDVSALKEQQQAATDAAESAKSAAEEALSNAKDANERVDNLVSSYKK